MKSINTKLIVAFLTVSILGIALVAILASYLVNTRSAAFENQAVMGIIEDELVRVYDRNDGWPKNEIARPNSREGAYSWVVIDALGEVVYRSRPGRAPTSDEVANATPLDNRGQTIGYLVLQQNRSNGPGGGRGNNNNNNATTPIEAEIERSMTDARRDFQNGIMLSLAIGAVGAVILALGVGIYIARTMTRPLMELTKATRIVAQGNLEHQVDVHSQDELGELAVAFNQMGQELANQQTLRRQMTADIAHDLRTPLSVILGHAEGLIDGVLPRDNETFSIIHDEAIRLNRLIDDLRTLSLADAGELPLMRRAVQPIELLERTVVAHAPRADDQKVNLVLDSSADLPMINVDPDRIAQVFDNLVSNALRYTPAGGRVLLRMRQLGQQLKVQVEDTGSGIPETDLPHIFDRFYRADKSRRRDGSGSGLGLAISRSIVEQHGGSISAESIVSVGTTFTILLPI